MICGRAECESWRRFRTSMPKFRVWSPEANWQGWKPEDLRPYLDVAFESFGAKRLMIGSDWPVRCTVAASYAQVVKTW